MNTLEIKVTSYDEMIKLGACLTSFTYPSLVIAMNGDLGAGKTSFTKGIGQALGVKRIINSPTFTIMKIYEPTINVNNIDKLYHLDVYRIENQDDDFELAEYFDLNGLSVVEWADIIKTLLPDTLWKVTINRLSETERLFILELKDHTNIESVKQMLEGNGYEVIYR